MQAELARRVDRDPVSLVHRYENPGDQEVAGLFCASLAYGRVDLFLPVLTRLLAAFGPSPRAYCEALAQRRDFSAFAGVVYRFNVGADLACLAWATGETLRSHGSLQALFLAEFSRTGDLRAALAGFNQHLRALAERAEIAPSLGPPRALHHLLPDASRGAASKRHLLYLRWMARPADGVDLGAWHGLDPAQLIVPVDTHLARLAHNLGLTQRRDLSWRTAEEITASLRLCDARDPVKYDFALCHFGMSGLCPAQRHRARCAGCALLPSCQAGQRSVRQPPARRCLPPEVKES